jgi:mannosyl-oligosaccharide glucosidase
MWTSKVSVPGHGWSPIRHWCEQGDQLATYGWRAHDGVNFGVQQIIDRQMIIATSFIKRPGGQHGGDWTAKIIAEPHVSVRLLMASFKYSLSFEVLD